MANSDIRAVTTIEAEEAVALAQNLKKFSYCSCGPVAVKEAKAIDIPVNAPVTTNTHKIRCKL